VQGATESVADAQDVLRKQKPGSVLVLGAEDELPELVLSIAGRYMAPARTTTDSPTGGNLVCIVHGLSHDREYTHSCRVEGFGASWRLAAAALVAAVDADAQQQQHILLRRRPDWPDLGFEFEPLTKERQRESGAKGGKAVVTTVRPDGAAAKAGLREGDAVAAVDSRGLKSAADLARAIYVATVGANLKLDVVQQGTRRTVTLAIP
jgi:membrane-associated protease RseP (regulator of RpoE activity)